MRETLDFSCIINGDLLRFSKEVIESLQRFSENLLRLSDKVNNADLKYLLLRLFVVSVNLQKNYEELYKVLLSLQDYKEELKLITK